MEVAAQDGELLDSGRCRGADCNDDDGPQRHSLMTARGDGMSAHGVNLACQ